jgi:hypothetical protein
VLSSYQALWEFGVRETRYANCHIVVVDEIAIRFYQFLPQKHRILSRIYVMQYHWYGTINGKWVGGRCLSVQRKG